MNKSIYNHEKIILWGVSLSPYELPPYLNYLEQSIENCNWIAGAQFSIADIALVTHFISLEQAGFQVDGEIWPNLYRYIQRVIARPAIKNLLSDTKSC